jgi:sugar lactone lactonase YvrE
LYGFGRLFFILKISFKRSVAEEITVMKTVKALALPCLVFGALATACIKSAIPTPPPPPSNSTSVAITGISPVAGAAGISDTLTGTGFSAAIALDSVYFNGKTASIISASTTRLIVVVPAGVSTGDVTVSVNGQVATGPLFMVGTDTATYLNDTAYIVSTLTSGILSVPSSLVLDANGNLFVVDYGHNLIRKVTPAGMLTTFAGSGQDVHADGMDTAAGFFQPQNITIDPSGILYVSEPDYNDIRKISPGAAVSTFIGEPTTGYVDGTGSAARFHGISALTCDNQGNLFVWDGGNRNFRKITPGTVVTTFAGSGTLGTADGTGTAASFGAAYDLCVDAANNIYVADGYYNTIRKITPSGVVTTIAGVADPDHFYDVDGVGTQAKFAGPSGIAADKYGNLYVSDWAINGATIRKITPSGVVTTIAGVPGVQGSADGPAHQATFQDPSTLVVAPNGVVYVCDEGAGSIRVLTPVR